MAIPANGTKNLKRNTKSIYIFPEYRKWGKASQLILISMHYPVAQTTFMEEKTTD